MKFVIVGAGSAGARHFATLVGLGVNPGSVTVADTATVALEKFPGCVPLPHTKLAEVLKQVKPGEKTAAIIATPPESHVAIAMECVNRGLHVLIEKPLCAIGTKPMDVSYKIAQLDLLAKSKHLTVMVGYPYRYSRGFQKLLASAQEAESIFSAYSYYGSKDAAHPQENVLSRVTVHQVNYMRALTRKVGSIAGTELTGSEPEVSYTKTDASLMLETICCPGFIASNVVSPIRTHSVVVETSNGRLQWNDTGEDIEQMNKTMISHFITAIDFGTPPDTPIHDALIDVRLLKVRTD